jgi:hypothetical protein
MSLMERAGSSRNKGEWLVERSLLPSRATTRVYDLRLRTSTRIDARDVRVGFAGGEQPWAKTQPLPWD